MRSLRYLGLVLAAFVLTVAGSTTAWAQEDGEARLGGASDVAGDAVVKIPQGGNIGPLHYIFVDNPEDQPIRVEFVADSPEGIDLVPEWEDTTVEAGGRAENTFGISVGPEVAAGEYPVVVQLVRSDIEAEPGQVTAIPAVQTSFTVEVTGDAGTLRVDSVSAISGQPVAGTLTAAAESADGEYFEVARADGSTLDTEVAPGNYRVAFLLGDRTLDTADVTVEADQTTEVTLEVETVSFVLAAARPTLEGDRPVVVDLGVSVNNEAERITAGAELRAVVLHNGTQVETVILEELAELPIGLTDTTATYRPTDGWNQGTYQFRFELATPEFVLTAPEIPTVDVPPAPALWDLRLLILIAAGTILLLLLLDRTFRAVARRIRERRQLKSDRHEPDIAPSAEEPEPAREGHSGLTKEPTVKWGPVPSHRQSVSASGQSDSRNQAGRNRSLQRNDDPSRPEHPVLIPPPVPSPRNARPPDSTTDRQDGAARVAQSVRLAQRLADDGALASDWSIADAAMVYWAMTSEEVHDALTSLGMDDQEYMTAVSKLLHLGLLDPSSR